jgi:hypothetical protein
MPDAHMLKVFYGVSMQDACAIPSPASVESTAKPTCKVDPSTCPAGGAPASGSETCASVTTLAGCECKPVWGKAPYAGAYQCILQLGASACWLGWCVCASHSMHSSVLSCLVTAAITLIGKGTAACGGKEHRSSAPTRIVRHKPTDVNRG